MLRKTMQLNIKFLTLLVSTLVILSACYRTIADTQTEPANRSKFKGYEVKFDYKGHSKQREIAYKI